MNPHLKIIELTVAEHPILDKAWGKAVVDDRVVYTWTLSAVAPYRVTADAWERLDDRPVRPSDRIEAAQMIRAELDRRGLVGA
jgi:hypothetical protein